MIVFAWWFGLLALLVMPQIVRRSMKGRPAGPIWLATLDTRLTTSAIFVLLVGAGLLALTGLWTLNVGLIGLALVPAGIAIGPLDHHLSHRARRTDDAESGYGVGAGAWLDGDDEIDHLERRLGC